MLNCFLFVKIKSFFTMKARFPPCCKSRWAGVSAGQLPHKQRSVTWGKLDCKLSAASATAHQKINDVQGAKPAAQSVQYPRIQRKKALQLCSG